MTTISKYAEMSSQAYEKEPSVSGWHLEFKRFDRDSGLRTVVFSNAGTYVVAFRGSYDLSDLVEDAQLTFGMNTAMYPVGEAIAEEAGRHGKVVLTGHSLGGAVAQVVGNRKSKPFVTFNAPGVALLASRNILSAHPGMAQTRLAGGVLSAFANPGQAMRDIGATFNVVTGKNYRLSNDIVSNTGVHYGDIVTLPSTAPNPLEAHYISSMQSVLSNGGAGSTNFQ